jgi:hypothetical protein
LLLEFGPGSKMDYRWIDADNLKTLQSFSGGLFAFTISDKEIIGWRQNSSRQTEVVIRKPDDEGRVINLSDYHSNKLVFVNEDTFAIESGYSSMPFGSNGRHGHTITHTSGA